MLFTLLTSAAEITAKPSERPLKRNFGCLDLVELRRQAEKEAMEQRERDRDNVVWIRTKVKSFGPRQRTYGPKKDDK